MPIIPVAQGFTGHYSINEVDDMGDLRSILNPGADSLNWLFLSTSGVHGSYMTLDELFQDDPGDDDYVDHITVLVVQPRMVRCYYGHITVTPEDVHWLRQQVTATLTAVAESQEGNTVASRSGE